MCKLNGCICQMSRTGCSVDLKRLNETFRLGFFVFGWDVIVQSLLLKVTSAIGSGKVCRPRSMSDSFSHVQLLSLHAWTSAACGAALAVTHLFSGR